MSEENSLPDELCDDCENRIRCMVGDYLSAFSIRMSKDDPDIRVGCYVTDGFRRIRVIDNNGSLTGYDIDSCTYVDVYLILESLQRTKRPDGPLICPYCGAVVYRLKAHLEKCKSKKRK